MTYLTNLEIKLNLIMSGKSRILENWRQLVPSITPEAFADAVRWLCADERDDHGRLTREVGLTRDGLVYINRVYDRGTGLCSMYRGDNGRLWTGDGFRVPCDNPLYADPDGMMWTHQKISISADDRI